MEDTSVKRYRLSDFEKIEKIGEGTFGKVYRAEYKDPDTGKVSKFALKKLNMIMEDMNDQGFPLTALREIKYLSSLHHENIVTIRQVIDSKRKSHSTSTNQPLTYSESQEQVQR